MPEMHISLFASFRVCQQGQVLTGFAAAKVQELFCYLLLHSGRPHLRESLAGTLWAEASDTQRARKQLRQTLWQLQAALNATAQNLLTVGPEWVRFDLTPQVHLDVALFEQAAAQAQRLRGQELPAETVGALEAAVQLYEGDLLEGWYQDWCLCERERLQNLYLAMLDKLMCYCEAHAQFEPGLGYGARVLRIDRAHELTHRRLMRLHYLAGDRTMALRQYESCAASLREELGVQPDHRTRLLLEQIRNDQLAPLPPPITAPAVATPMISLSEVLSQMQKLQLLLTRLQQQIGEHLKPTEIDAPPRK